MGLLDKLKSRITGKPTTEEIQEMWASSIAQIEFNEKMYQSMTAARKRKRIELANAMPYNPTSELGKLLKALIQQGSFHHGNLFMGVDVNKALQQADKLSPPVVAAPFVERARQFEDLGNNLVYEHANALSCLTSWCLIARQMLDGQEILIPEKGFNFHMSPDFVHKLSNLFTDSMDLIGVETYVQVAKPLQQERVENVET